MAYFHGREWLNHMAFFFFFALDIHHLCSIASTFMQRAHNQKDSLKWSVLNHWAWHCPEKNMHLLGQKARKWPIAWVPTHTGDNIHIGETETSNTGPSEIWSHHQFERTKPVRTSDREATVPSLGAKYQQDLLPTSAVYCETGKHLLIP
jgi:hypothetical protein